jgi:hypothetical protein
MKSMNSRAYRALAIGVVGGLVAATAALVAAIAVTTRRPPS